MNSRQAYLKGFLVVLVTTFMTVIPFPRTALAACGGFNGFTVKAPLTNQYGARVLLDYVVNPVTDCGIVRSVAIQTSIQNYVEIGWYEDDGAGGFGFTDCEHYSAPHILVFAAVNGFAKCKPNTQQLTAGESYSFRVDNPDHDFDFVYYWDADTSPNISLGFYATDISTGKPNTWDERHETSDSLRATLSSFNSLSSGGAWQGYPGADLSVSGSTVGWSVCSWSATSLVAKGTGSC